MKTIFATTIAITTMLALVEAPAAQAPKFKRKCEVKCIQTMHRETTCYRICDGQWYRIGN